MNSELREKEGKISFDKLETYLFKLNLETDNRLAILKDIKKFLADDSSHFRSSSLKKFFIGDKELPGIIQIFCLNGERNYILDMECRK